MAAERAPAFQFYPKDFLADANVSAMSLVEVGAYIRLLSLCWLEGSLPTDHARLARMLGVSVGAFRKLWPAVSLCFREQDGRYIQPRLDRERRKQVEFRGRQSERGKRSGHVRRLANGAEPNRMRTGIEPDMNGALVEPDANGALVERESNSPISSLQVPPNPPSGGQLGEDRPKLPERFIADPEIADRAATLLGRYPQIYAKARSGAASPIRESRDWPKALELAATFTDADRLCLMAEVFLKRTDIGPKNIPGTLGQFAHMAPDCDRLLREHGR